MLTLLLKYENCFFTGMHASPQLLQNSGDNNINNCKADILIIPLGTQKLQLW